MAGMSFSMRSTEERISKQLQKTAERQQQQWQTLSQQLHQQAQYIQYQNAMMQQQQSLIVELTKMMQSMQAQQDRMNVSIEQLQQTIMRQRQSEDNVYPGTELVKEGETHTEETHHRDADDVSTKSASSNWLQYASMKDP